MPGRVYLLGAGPGDPDLITVKGRRALERASVVLYDHLAPEELLDLAPSSAKRVYVGKKRSDHTFTQEEISQMLISFAQDSQIVVRLKGGDPYLFGRGGEEAEALAAAGIPFEVIPGVTSALGIAAYTGVPLTHREHTSVVSIATGHNADGIDWERFGHSETLVILMGLATFATISARIIAGGRNPDTPAIAVRWGTRSDQESIQGTLSSLPSLIESHRLKPPATIIIGDVVNLRSRLNWFEKLPLFGKRVVVTRPRAQAGELLTKLRELGADPIELPTISIEPSSDFGPLDRAISNLGKYDWLIFTSVNGVRAFFERLDQSAFDLRHLRARLAAIGPATRGALEDAHLKVDVIGQEFVAESLVLALREHDLRGRHILLVRAAVARDVLPTQLIASGAHVEVVEAYRTLPPPDLARRAAELLSTSPHWFTFTSSSTVDNLFAVVDPETFREVRIASIGPITSSTLRAHSLEPSAEAAVFTTDGLIDAILQMR